MQPNGLMLQRVLLLSLLLGLIVLSGYILKFFVVPILWAAIISYTTWGIYQRIDRVCGHRHNLSALLMTISVVLVVGVPITIGIFMLQSEGRQLFIQLQQQLSAGHIRLPTVFLKLPIVGTEMARLVNDINHDPQVAIAFLKTWFQSHIGYGRYVLSSVASNIAKFGLAMLSLFFFYRDGELLLNQIRRAIGLIIGERVHHYFVTISETTRAVVYGVGLTAVVQSLLAGASYWVAGVPKPMLMTLLTFILALIPFGPPIAYGSTALWLFSQNQHAAAIGVFVWGALVVSSADNVIRPLVISGATQIPFLFIMFGVLGGIASFGLVGLFIGPVILAVLLACWREWLHDSTVLPSATSTQSDSTQSNST